MLPLPSLAVFRGTSKGNLLRNPRPRRLWERKHEIAIPRTPCSEAFIDNQIPILSSFISPSLLPASPNHPVARSSIQVRRYRAGIRGFRDVYRATVLTYPPRSSIYNPHSPFAEADNRGSS